MKTIMSTWFKSREIFSRFFLLSSVVAFSGEMGLWVPQKSCSAGQPFSCGCEVVEPTCKATACEAACAVPYDGACESTGCDACGRTPQSVCNSRRFSLPEVGEGLLDGLDRITDKFERGFGRLVTPTSRARGSCDSCSGLSGCQCESVHQNDYASTANSYQSGSVADTFQSSDLPNQMPVPLPLNSQTVAPTLNEPINRSTEIPVQSPRTPPAMPKPEPMANPFLDEARLRPKNLTKNLPQVHVAKIQTSVRGSTRRRYLPQSQPSVIEATNPEDRIAPEVVTAGAIRGENTPSKVYAR